MICLEIFLFRILHFKLIFCFTLSFEILYNQNKYGLDLN